MTELEKVQITLEVLSDLYEETRDPVFQGSLAQVISLASKKLGKLQF